MGQETSPYTPEVLNTQGQTVLVLRDALHHLDDPALTTALNRFHFDKKLFVDLLHGTYTNWERVLPPMTYPEDHPVEEINVREVRTQDNKLIECTQTTASLPYDGWVHLQDPQGIGFEAILVTKTNTPEGRMIYRFPNQVDAAAAGLYAQSESEENIQLASGDLIIIPFGIGRQTDLIGEVSYTYIGPSWEQSPPIPALSPSPRERLEKNPAV